MPQLFANYVGFVITPRKLSLKTELAGRDNEAYVIGKELWQTEGVKTEAATVLEHAKTRLLPSAQGRQVEMT